MNWKVFLQNVSKGIIEEDVLEEKFRKDTSDYLGFPGASEEDISLAEQRLGCSLPPSYKDFLRSSNGFKQLNHFVWDIYPTHKIDWLGNLEADFVEQTLNNPVKVEDEHYFVYGKEQDPITVRPEYFQHCLAVSGWGDVAIVLLNPEVRFQDEWEAWMWASWIPGANRYRSFEELMIEEYQNFWQVINYEEEDFLEL